jgi:hypothetical protein
MAGFSWKVDMRSHAADEFHKAAEAALADAAEYLLEESNRTVPHEEGTLERSGTVSVDGLKAAVSYDTPYAVRQHEDTRLRHDDGRRAKWLEQTFNERADKVRKFLADRMQAALR